MLLPATGVPRSVGVEAVNSRRLSLLCRILRSSACTTRPRNARHQTHHQQPLLIPVTSKQTRASSWPCKGVLNTDVCAADSWALTNRAALLGLKVEELNAHMQSHPDHAWMAVCEPDRLFALREVCKLLGADVAAALRLVQQEPGLLKVPAAALEDKFEGLQALLPLPRPALLQLLCAEPSLLLAGRQAVEAGLQRAARDLGLEPNGPDAARLLQLLSTMGPEALLDPRSNAVQQVNSFSTALSVCPSDALALLSASSAAGAAAPDLMAASGVEALSREWGQLSEEMELQLGEVMAALAGQLSRPDARYLLGSAQLLRSDVQALQQHTQLQPGLVCSLLLAAPRLALVPASFWQLLLQYLLFLVPRWRRQLKQMAPSQAGLLLAQLFDKDGADVMDEVAVRGRDALFTTADVDFNQELAVLEALLDQGVAAPRFKDSTHICAGRVWRLIYLCNPRLVPGHSSLDDAAEDSKDGEDSASGSRWSWVLSMQLPRPLLDHMQRLGALTGAGAAGGGVSPATAANNAGGAAGPATQLSEVVSASTAEFCARHSGYAHWLHNAAFELEWANSKAAAPVATWDP